MLWAVWLLHRRRRRAGRTCREPRSLGLGGRAGGPDVQCPNCIGMGRGGGYIVAPCHNIQANTPPENVVAMYEKGYDEGWRRF